MSSTMATDVRSVFDLPRVKLFTLEDGERVVRFRGNGKFSREIHPSDNAHAGHWSSTQDYVLIPHPRPRQIGRSLVRFGLDNRSSEAEVLALGPPEAILRACTEGPRCVRAVRRRVAPLGTVERLQGTARGDSSPDPTGQNEQAREQVVTAAETQPQSRRPQA